MPDLRRYAPGTRTRRRTWEASRWGRGDGAHVRPRRVPVGVLGALTGAVLAAPGVYLAAGYGAGTPPVWAYLTGLALGAAMRPAVARWRR